MTSVQSEVSETSARWTIAVFSARETAHVLLACVRAVLVACAGRSAVIDILVNGNKKLAEELARGGLAKLDAPPDCHLRLWYLEMADKSNAWNEYIERIWPGSATAYFVDGYVRVQQDALGLMHQALTRSEFALAASGVPTMGRSSRRLQREMVGEGGIHGNLYALRGSAVERLRSSGFRLPLGLYRTDPLLGAVLAFNLDPASNDWNLSRICVVPNASWEYDGLDWWRPSHLRTHLKRMIRQGQGSLENAAIRRYLATERKRPEGIPRTVRELVLPWMNAFPGEARAVFMRRPLSYFAARRLRVESAALRGQARARLVQELATRRKTVPRAESGRGA